VKRTGPALGRRSGALKLSATDFDATSYSRRSMMLASSEADAAYVFDPEMIQIQ
jgi:hypothetical protein